MANVLLKDRFMNCDKISAAKCPILLIHGINDTLVPAFHSKELHKKTQNKHSRLELREGMSHNDFDMYSDIINPMVDFWQSIDVSSASGMPIDHVCIANFANLIVFYLSGSHCQAVR